MYARCPRCQLEFDAASPWAQCPRCGAGVVCAAPAQHVAPTQAVDPALLAQVVRGAAHSPAAARSPAAAPARPGFVPDEDLAGRAVMSVVLSVVALLGGCNPVGLLGIALGLMAYAAANDRRVDLARARGRSARRVAYASLGITAAVWAVVVLSLFYEF
jgi:rubredoxin